jgi:hypothetical protein
VRDQVPHLLKTTGKFPNTDFLIQASKEGKSHHRSVSIALGYRLDNGGSRVQFLVRLGIFLFTTMSRTALGPSQHPMQWVPGDLSLGLKRPGREADRSPPSNAEVKNAWSYTSTPQYVFMACCLVKHRGNFTFTILVNRVVKK